MSDELMQLPTGAADMPPLPEMAPTVPQVYYPPPHGIREFPVSRQFCEVDRVTRDVLIVVMQVSAPEDTDDTYFVATDPPFDYAETPRRRVTQVLRHLGGTVVGWEDTIPLEEMIREAIADTYANVDDVYMAAVGYRTTEYMEAEAAARAYLAAESHPEDEYVSDFITSHAPKAPPEAENRNLWSAQSIVERADAFRWAVRQMRSVRASSQAEMSAATNSFELDYARAHWEDFIRWIRGVLEV